jgi:hypothetical protein
MHGCNAICGPSKACAIVTIWAHRGAVDSHPDAKGETTKAHAPGTFSGNKAASRSWSERGGRGFHSKRHRQYMGSVEDELLEELEGAIVAVL